MIKPLYPNKLGSTLHFRREEEIILRHPWHEFTDRANTKGLLFVTTTFAFVTTLLAFCVLTIHIGGGFKGKGHILFQCTLPVWLEAFPMKTQRTRDESKSAHWFQVAWPGVRIPRGTSQMRVKFLS